MSANSEEFSAASELKVWLQGRGVREKVASATASTLFQKGFDAPSTLLGLSSEQLERNGLSTPSANELSNALKQVGLNFVLVVFSSLFFFGVLCSFNFTFVLTLAAPR